MINQQMQSGLFGELINIESVIHQMNQKMMTTGIMKGRITHIEKPNQKSRVRVARTDINTNYSTYWLEPTNNIGTVLLGDTVLFCYPTNDTKNGVYFSSFSIHDSGYATEEWVADQILESIEAYDGIIKAWTNTNFPNNAELAAALVPYVTNTNLTTQLLKYTSRYINHNFYRLNVGNLVMPVTWIDKQVSLNVGTAGDANNLGIVLNAANNNNMGSNHRVYLKNTMSGNAVNLTPQDGISINAQAANTSFSLAVLKQYEVRKGTSNTNYTLTEIPFGTNPY